VKPYAVASRSWPRGSIAVFLSTSVPRVREAVRNLDLIALLPVAAHGVQAELIQLTTVALRV